MAGWYKKAEYSLVTKIYKSNRKYKMFRKRFPKYSNARLSRISNFVEQESNGESTLTVAEKLEFISERPDFSKLRAAEDAAASDSE